MGQSGKWYRHIGPAAVVSLIILPATAMAQSVGETFQDCPDCPEMVVIPSGSGEIGTEPWEANRKGGDGPLRTVTIDYSLAVAKNEVTRAQFRAFVEDSGYEVPDTGCNTWGTDRVIGFVQSHRWDDPGYPQTEKHPVVCVSHADATAYAAWLAQMTGKPYRLVSSTEFEYATRAGSRGPWFWGPDNADACTYANVADGTFRRLYTYGAVFNCTDGYERTAPVGSFEANPWGLNDMLGNAWEWTDDCAHEDMSQVPVDGRAWLAEENGNCDIRVPRGGSWVSGADWVRAAAQAGDGATYHSQLMGFRVALTVN